MEVIVREAYASASRPADAKDYLLVGGLAAPPQLDLLINSGYYKDGRFTRPSFERLAVP